MVNADTGPPVFVNVEKKAVWHHLRWFRYDARLEGKALYPHHSSQLQSSSHCHILCGRPCNQRCSGTLLFFFFVTGKYHESYLLPVGPTSQERCIKTSTSWCRSHRSYTALGGHRVQVTLSDNTVPWRMLSSCVAKTETANVLESVISTMNVTVNSVVNPTSAYPNCLFPYIYIQGRHKAKLLHIEPTIQSPTVYGM